MPEFLQKNRLESRLRQRELPQRKLKSLLRKKPLAFLQKRQESQQKKKPRE